MFNSSNPWLVLKLSQLEFCINNVLCFVIEQKLRLYPLNIHLPWFYLLVFFDLSLKTPRCWSFMSKCRGMWSLVKVDYWHPDYFVYNASRLSVTIAFWAWIRSLAIYATRETSWTESIRSRDFIIANHNKLRLYELYEWLILVFSALIFFYLVAFFVQTCNHKIIGFPDRLIAQSVKF